MEYQKDHIRDLYKKLLPNDCSMSWPNNLSGVIEILSYGDFYIDHIYNI